MNVDTGAAVPSWRAGSVTFEGDGVDDLGVGMRSAPGNAAGTVTVLKVRPGTMESAKALAEADLGFPAGTHGDAFGIALPH